MRYRLPRFRCKRQNQHVATFWRHKSIEIDRLNNKLDLWSIQKQEQDLIIWQKSWNAQMLHFLLCRESVLGMPRIEIEFEFDMVFCFGIHLALYAVCFFVGFFTWIYLQHIARPVENDRPINIMFVRLPVRTSVDSLWMYGHNSTTAWDIFMQFLWKDPRKIYLIKTMWFKPLMF